MGGAGGGDGLGAARRGAGDDRRPDDEGFRKLLDEVRRRTAELEQRDREVTERAAALESLEDAVAESLSGNPARAGVEDVGSCRLHGGVTRIYENMRPEEAAQILDQLDDETLRVVFARMDAEADRRDHGRDEPRARGRVHEDARRGRGAAADGEPVVLAREPLRQAPELAQVDREIRERRRRRGTSPASASVLR